MTTIKRSFQSLKNLKKRTLIIGLIFLLVSTFLMSGSIVKGSLQSMLNSAKKEVNPIATIESDLDSLMKDMLTGGQKSTSKQIDDALVDEVKNSKYVQSYSVQGAADISLETSNNTNKSDSSLGSSYQGPTNTLEVLDNPTSSIARAQTNLVSGRYVTAEDRNKVIVSESYLKKNNLKLGDNVKIVTDTSNMAKTETVQTEIVGVYKLSSSSSDVQKKLEEQTFYSNRQLFSDIKKEQFKSMPTNSLAGYSKIKVNLKDPMDTEKFFTEIKGNLNLDGIKFSSSYNQYKSMSSIVDNIVTIFSVIQIAIFVIAGILVTLLMLISLRERKYEIGLLRALGESKGSVLIQMFLEVFIVFFAVFTIGFGLSKFVITPTISTGISKQVNQSMAPSDSSSGQLIKGPYFEEDKDSNFNYKQPEAIANTTSVESVIIIFTSLTVIILLSTTLPTKKIVKQSPQSILSTTQ